MMISYSGHSKLRTKPILYEDVILACDSLTLEHLKELSSKRKAVEQFANESSFVSEAIAREMYGGLTSRCEQGVQMLEQYIPLVENLVHNVNENRSHPRIGGWISELKIRWSSALAPASIFPFHGPKFYQINDIEFELGMSLFLYATLLQDLALEVLTSDIVKSAVLFRQAAGVYNHLAENVLLKLSGNNNAQEKPPEATSSMCSVMCLVCLAEAQAVTAKKAEEIGNSKGIVVKLHLGVCEFLHEAIQIVSKNCKNASPQLLDFLQTSKSLHMAMSQKFLAQGLRNEGQIGAAIMNLRCAVDVLKRTGTREEKWRSELTKMIDELGSLMRKYKQENEFVWHENVTEMKDALPLPVAAKIVGLIAYRPCQWERTLLFKS